MMKKRIGCLIAVLCVLALFTACNRLEASDKNEEDPGGIEMTRNSTLESLNLEAQQDKILAVILNFPKEETLNKVEHLKTFESDDSNETLLLVPVQNGTFLEVKTLEWDNDTLKETGTVYKAEKTEDGYGLYLRAIRPEGAPLLKIVVESPTGARGEYLITYNGNEGTPEKETIEAE